MVASQKLATGTRYTAATTTPYETNCSVAPALSRRAETQKRTPRASVGIRPGHTHAIATSAISPMTSRIEILRRFARIEYSVMAVASGYGGGSVTGPVPYLNAVRPRASTSSESTPGVIRLDRWRMDEPRKNSAHPATRGRLVDEYQHAQLDLRGVAPSRGTAGRVSRCGSLDGGGRQQRRDGADRGPLSPHRAGRNAAVGVSALQQRSGDALLHAVVRRQPRLFGRSCGRPSAAAPAPLRQPQGRPRRGCAACARRSLPAVSTRSRSCSRWRASRRR